MAKMINDDFVKYENSKNDEYIRLYTTIIGIDNLISKASSAEEANALFKAKDVIYSQQKHFIYRQPDNGWISVKDRLPPTGVPVLIYVYNIEEMTVVSLDHDGLGFSNADEWFNIKNIHHWRHLPEPPKGE